MIELRCRPADLVFAMLVGFVRVAGAQGGQPPEVVFTPVSELVDLIEVRSPRGPIGANLVAFHSGSDLVLVDLNLPVPQLARYLEATILRRYSVDAVDRVVITHWHPDHSGGIGLLASGTRVMSQEDTRRILAAPQEGHGLGRVDQDNHFPARDSAGLPDETFGTVRKFELADSTIVVEHAPASHTAGDAVVRLPGGVVAIGDLVWPGAFPFVDYYNGGTAWGLLEALERLYASSDEATRFIPGHGNAFGRDELADYLVMVRGTLGAVAAMKRQGISLAEAQAKGLAGWEQWASELVPERVWIEMIWRSGSPPA